MARSTRQPPRPPDDEDLDFEPVDDPLDADLLQDLTDDEPDGEGLDLDDDLLPEEPLDLGDVRGPEAPDLPFEHIGEALLEEETDEWDLLGEDTAPAAKPPPGLVALPWSTRATILALQLEVPTVLDPTRPDSEWRVAEPPERERIEVRVRVGPVEARVSLRVVQAEPHGLVLGRDVLAGRILVQS